MRVFPESRWGSAKIFRELVREIKQSKSQLAHPHKQKDMILGVPATRFAGVSHVVRTVHGLREPFQGLPSFKMSFYKANSRIVHRYYVDAIIGVSLQIERKYDAKGEVSRIICIRNRTDLEGSRS